MEEALFDPLSTDSISAKLVEFLSRPELIERMKAHAKIQAPLFSWDASAQKAIAGFESLIAKRHIQGIQNPKLSKAQILDKLIVQLGQLAFDGKHYKDVDLLQFSACLAQNFPTEPRKHQILIDISELVKRDAKTGIQRVVRSLLTEMLLNPPADYDVHPIYANQLSLGYRYANRFKKKFFASEAEQRAMGDSNTNNVEDPVIETPVPENGEESAVVKETSTEELPPVVPSIQNIDNEPVITRLSFNDYDSIMDTENKVDTVNAPKTIERLEEISTSRAIQRKLEEESDSDDDNDRITIDTEPMDLTGFELLDGDNTLSSNDIPLFDFEELP
jgi:hypothetical protein